MHQNAGIPTHSCGGTIIDDSTILTAAHCFKYGATLDFVHAGIVGFYHTEGGQHVGIKDIIIHPNYKNGSRDGGHDEEDYAIVKLRSPLIFNDKVQPACLPDNYQSKQRGGLFLQW